MTISRRALISPGVCSRDKLALRPRLPGKSLPSAVAVAAILTSSHRNYIRGLRLKFFSWGESLWNTRFPITVCISRIKDNPRILKFSDFNLILFLFSSDLNLFSKLMGSFSFSSFFCCETGLYFPFLQRSALAWLSTLIVRDALTWCLNCFLFSLNPLRISRITFRKNAGRCGLKNGNDFEFSATNVLDVFLVVASVANEFTAKILHGTFETFEGRSSVN